MKSSHSHRWWRGIALLVSLSAAAAAFSCGTSDETSGGTHRPNIVFILADDLGYDDVGCYWTPDPTGEYAKIETANIDKLASEGMLFTDFYAPASVCTPSRGALLTGCYPPRISLSNPSDTTGIIDKHSDLGMHPREVTVAEFLKERGYTTGCVGKWHLGPREPFWPTRQGFDYYYGLLYGHRQKDNYLMRGESAIDTIPHQNLTDLYTAEAVRFIRDNKDRPFFLYFAHSAPHVPLTVPERFAGRSARGSYGDAVMNMDWSVGEVMRALNEEGLDANTIVWFTSDNGPALAKGERGGSCFPLRGGKGMVFEGGFRVPCIVRWPGRIAAASQCTEMATAMDLLPTLARIIDADLPAAPAIDGHDISPLLFGEAGAHTPYDAFFYYGNGALRAVRSGQWKLHFRHRDGRVVPGPLFDFEADIGERRNVASEHPDRVEELARLAERMRLELGDSSVGQRGKGQRPRARAREDDSLEDVFSDF